MTAVGIGLVAVALIAISSILAVVRRPQLIDPANAGTIAFFSFVALPGLFLLGGATRHYEAAKSTEFCVACHAIAPFADSLRVDHPDFLPASHVQNARISRERSCYTCHTSYTMFGDFDDKVRGLRHVWHAVVGGGADPVELYRPFPNRNCLSCHAGARTYVEAPEHQEFLADLAVEARSCIMCHNLVHEIPRLDRFERWDPPAP